MSTDQPEEVTAEQAETDQTPEVVETAAATESPAEESSAVAGLTLGSGAPADAEVDPDFQPVVRGKIDRFGAALGTGRRKTAVARVRLKDGTGQIIVNDKPLDEFFCIERDRAMILAPLKATGMADKVDVLVRVSGGGTTGQTGAVVLGVARALQVRDESLHHKLAEGGWLTRDGRMVERKKYGFRKARRSFQFSKR